MLPNNAQRDSQRRAGGRARQQAVRVVPTRSVQAGLAAMIAYDPERSAAENEAAMTRALEGVATGEVTIASRDVDARRDRGARRAPGSGSRTATPSPAAQSFDAVAGAVAERLLDGGREILTLLTGAEEPALDAARRARSRRATRSSRSRSTRAASRTTRCCSRRSDDGGAGAARRGQRGLPVDARAAARRA